MSKQPPPMALGSRLIKRSPVSSQLPSSPHLSIALLSSHSQTAKTDLLLFFLLWILLNPGALNYTSAGKQAYEEH